MDRQLGTVDCLLGAGLADQHLGQRSRFAAGDRPADDVAGDRCPRSRRGSSRSTSLGHAISLYPRTTPHLGRWRRVRVSLSPDGWPGRGAHAPRRPGAATAFERAALHGDEVIETPIGDIALIDTYIDDDASARLFDEMDYQRVVQAYMWVIRWSASPPGGPRRRRRMA